MSKRQYERPIAYDREVCITICRRRLVGEDLGTICAKPPMPIGPVFLGWVQDHKEARDIYRSMCDFQMHRAVGKELGLIPTPSTASEWEEQVRANLQRGFPADWRDRKYIPPDWSKVYPLISNPPVLPSESRQDYDDLITDMTDMLRPRDRMELVWLKEVADAIWEATRIARKKAALPATSVKYRALDIAQARAMRRHDHALRQIQRWRKGLGATARALPERFLDAQLVLDRYTADVLGWDAKIDEAVAGRAKADQPRVPQSEAVETASPAPAPVAAPLGDIAEAASVVADAPEAAEAATPLVATQENTEATPALAAAAELTDAALVSVPAGDILEAGSMVAGAANATETTPLPATDETTEAAPSALGSGAQRMDAARPLVPVGNPAQAAFPLAPMRAATEDATDIDTTKRGPDTFYGAPGPSRNIAATGPRRPLTGSRERNQLRAFVES